MPDTNPETPAGPLFSYDVPQEVTYSGQSFIDLQVPLEYFAAQTIETGESPS